MISERIGEIIKRRRLEMGISQKELAELSGVSQGYISDIENGKKKNPTIESLMHIAKALNVKSGKLIGESYGFDDVEIEGAGGLKLDLDGLPLEAQIKVIEYFEMVRQKYLDKK